MVSADRAALGIIAAACGLAVVSAKAQTPAPAREKPAIVELDPVEAYAEQLDAARLQIQPSLGASTYSFGSEALQTIPQGANAPLNQVLLQAPGVAQDGFGQIHVRGDHSNLQYRVNGVQLPEGLALFGQALQTRFARSVSLITGALPAQYGFLTAGVIDIQTKTGDTNPGLALSMYGGSFGWLQPSMEYGGRNGPVDWFIAGDYLQNQRGIENPAPTFNAQHDRTRQFHGFASMSGIVDPDTRVSLFGGAFDGRFQIPNNPGQSPDLGLDVNGVTSFNSARLNQNQTEATQFGVASLQKRAGEIDLQVSAFVRNSALSYAPDFYGDLLFNGIAQSARRSNLAGGVQADMSWRFAEGHTLRAGFLAQIERSSFNTSSSVLPVDADGAQTSNQTLVVIDNGAKTGGIYGAYLQDEWRILPVLTLNYGLRVDAVNQYTNESQVSPRVNAVWKATETTTVFAGYSRYFTPPAFQRVAPTSVAGFAGTTAAPAILIDDTVRVERSNYFDVGVSQILAPGLSVTLDGYYKRVSNLLDEGQFGAPVILSSFNYASADIGGAVLSISYDQGPWSAYGNAAYSRAMATNIISSQFNFDPDELAYIAQHYIHTDHDQTWTASAGLAYTFNKGEKFQTRASIDMLAQSGLRAAAPNVPNGASLPAYAVFNASLVQKLDLGFGAGTELRFDVLNLGDAAYLIRDGSGVGVGAPQYGLRRTFLAGLTQRF